MDACRNPDEDLEKKILVAHQNNDGLKLAELYAEAAYNSPNKNKACFFMVNAYTLALECINTPKRNLSFSSLKNTLEKTRSLSG